MHRTDIVGQMQRHDALQREQHRENAKRLDDFQAMLSRIQWAVIGGLLMALWGITKGHLH